MGIVRLEETRRAELDEFRRMLLSCAAVHRRKDDEGLGGGEEVDNSSARNGDVLDRLVCVTSGVSYLGIAIVNQLLVNGYSVRIIVDNEEDVEKLREMEISGEMSLNNCVLDIVMAKMSEVESLVEAFNGCRGVFHTGGFVDPAGLSGYTKSMSVIEVNATKNVMRACRISSSVKHCVLTSSLLTCVWRDNSADEVSHLIDHKSWSDESLCINKKLWYALGKLRAEKVAWEMAKDSGVRLATICPGLVTGPDYYNRNPTSTIAYLKGVQEMYSYGLLATVDINKLAKVHVRVFEEMKKAISGRYVCFDRVIETRDEIEKLACDTGIDQSLIRGGASCSTITRFELSNAKIVSLMSRTQRCIRE